MSVMLSSVTVSLKLRWSSDTGILIVFPAMSVVLFGRRMVSFGVVVSTVKLSVRGCRMFARVSMPRPSRVSVYVPSLSGRCGVNVQSNVAPSLYVMLMFVLFLASVAFVMIAASFV